MPALNLDLVSRELVRRSNWPAHNAGVMLVFCILGVLALGGIALLIQKRIVARKARQTT